MHVVEAVTRSGVNSHLGYALADRLTVAEVAGFRGTEAGEDAGPTDGVFEAGEPRIELVRPQQRVHVRNVSLWIRPCKGPDRTAAPADRSTLRTARTTTRLS
jgi:hypothetical protein